MSQGESSYPAVNRRAWICSILASAGILTTGKALLASESQTWTPQFLSAEQNQALMALGERIVPGSTAAFCNRVIDLIMTVESNATRQELLNALAEFDTQAQRHHQKNYRDLTPPQQDQILTFAANDTGRLHFQFGVVKEWVADAYWSSEKGLRELGWTGRMAWQSFPGCGHPGAHN